MPFQSEKLEIPGLIIVNPRVFEDSRGSFFETYKESDFRSLGIGRPFVQWNHAVSRKEVLRGLHYQIHPAPQGKMLRVLRGELFDVAVDIRKGSPWFGKWVSVLLSSENRSIFWIPPGFAHGYMAITDDAEVLYGTTTEWTPSCERGIRWNDPSLAVEWPLPEPLVNERDQAFPLLADAEITFVYGEEL